MTDNTLNTVSFPHAIVADDFNQFATALVGDFVGRDATTKAASSAEKCGTPTIPWAEGHFTNLFLGGALLDLDNLGTNTKNAINDGRTRSGSGQPDFIRAAGNAATATILATDTDLKYTANNVGVILTADVDLTSIDTAPATNNTATVNDTSLAGGDTTKYHGEGFGGSGGSIALDAVGTEISDRVREYVCLKHGTDELMIAFVDEVDTGAATATLTNVYRGFFFDDNGDPIVREVMSDNDSLTLMSLGWVFGQNNGTVFDISYKSPIWSATEPSSPATDDYWFDQVNQNWKRYDGSSFVEINRILLGMVVADSSNCIASRSIDFTKTYDDLASVNMSGVPVSVTQVQTSRTFSKISVYGSTFEYNGSPIIWDITTDLESGLTEETDKLYYLYITEQGATKISDEPPYNRLADLRGYYHPYHSWRAIGTVLNDTDDIVSANTAYVTVNGQFTRYVDFDASDDFIPGQYDIINNLVKVEAWGGGGGGGRTVSGSVFGGGGNGGYASDIVDLTGITSVAVTVGAGGNGSTSGNVAGSNGGSSSFGSDVVATGGKADSSTTGADGGYGTAGSKTLQGSKGAASAGGTASGVGGLGFNYAQVGGASTSPSHPGEGGTSRWSSNGISGADGKVRIWY